MRERVLAILAAVALVAVAIVARTALADDDGTGPGRKGASGRPVVACTPDLMAVCDALAADGRIAADPPELDLDEAGAPDAAIDGWITWDPAPSIANFDAGSEIWVDEEAVAAASLITLVAPKALASLRRDCPDALTWSCIAHTDEPGVTVGTGSPDTSEGLARLVPLASSLSEQQDPATLDVPRLTDLLSGPVGNQLSAVDQADQLVTIGPAAVSVVVGPSPLLTRLGATDQGRERRMAPVSPSPSTRLLVVLSTRQGSDLGSLADRILRAEAGSPVGRALAAAGVSGGPGKLADDDVAGFLYQVRKKVGS
jgi:hypothetical protein